MYVCLYWDKKKRSRTHVRSYVCVDVCMYVCTYWDKEKMEEEARQPMLENVRVVCVCKCVYMCICV